MNPNSISHRLFAAALSQVPASVAKGAERGSNAVRRKEVIRRELPAPEVATAKAADWSWSGWQHPTL